MSIVTKVILNILMHRAKQKFRREVAEEQYGFVRGKGTRNAIYIVRMLAERAIEMQKDLFICFIDYTKAFDKVRHEELFKILQRLDIDGKDLRLLQNLYWEQTATIRIDRETGKWVKIRRGVQQGCVLSPDLFSIYSEMIMRAIKDVEGIAVGGHNINNIRYADDTALIADSEAKLQEILSIVARESEAMGLSINCKKTFSLVISKLSLPPICNLKINGMPIKQVNNFGYLGSDITSDAKCDHEIKKRVGIAKKTFNDMSHVFKRPQINMSSKLRLLKTYVWSVLLYGCETWTISRQMRTKLVLGIGGGELRSSGLELGSTGGGELRPSGLELGSIGGGKLRSSALGLSSIGGGKSPAIPGSNNEIKA